MNRLLRALQSACLMMVWAMFLAPSAEARDRYQTQGGDSNRNSKLGPGDEFVVKRVKDADEIKRWYFTYFVEFTGPSADFALPLESFSQSADFYAPMALFQSFTPSYALSPDNRVGIEIAMNQPLQSEVLDKNFNYYSSEFTVYDPFVFLQANNLFTNSYSWINSKFSVYLPTSDFSREVGKITAFYVGPTWNFRLPNPSFYFNLYTDLYYYLYDNPQGWTRFAAGTGHTAGYNFNRHWSIDTTSTFDFNMISQGNHGYTFSEGSVDHVKITARFQPVPNVWQFGAFLISPIYHRTLDRMAVGLNMNVWL